MYGLVLLLGRRPSVLPPDPPLTHDEAGVEIAGLSGSIDSCHDFVIEPSSKCNYLKILGFLLHFVLGPAIVRLVVVQVVSFVSARLRQNQVAVGSPFGSVPLLLKDRD